MINVKELVYAKLKIILPEVSDAFPADWETPLQIQYTEEENKSHERAGNVTTKSYVRYKVDVWSATSTTDIAIQVDTALSEELGLTRTACYDMNEAERKHKVMRYEGIVAEKSGKILGI